MPRLKSQQPVVAVKEGLVHVSRPSTDGQRQPLPSVFSHLGESLKLGAQQADEWLMASFLGQELNLEVNPGVFSVMRSHRLASDVEGGAGIDDSLPAVVEESSRVRLGFVKCHSTLPMEGCCLINAVL